MNSFSLNHSLISYQIKISYQNLLCFYKYKPLLPNDGFGECGLSEAILGCLDGARTDIFEPRRSCPCNNLLSRNSDTFIRRGFGVLKIVRFSRQRAL